MPTYGAGLSREGGGPVVNSKPLTHALEKALTEWRYGPKTPESALRLARIADAELLSLIEKLDRRLTRLEAERGLL